MNHYKEKKVSSVHKFGFEHNAILKEKKFESAYAREAPIFALLASIIPSFKVLSLDVFDTILWRDTKSELERFHDIAKRFTEKYAAIGARDVPSLRAALTARLFAASNAYQLSESIDGCVEGRFDEIIEHTIDILRLEKAQIGLWKSCELEVEAAQLTPSPFAEKIINLANKNDVEIIATSDMYFSSTDIRNLLKACDLKSEAKIGRIFSSADTILNKRNGKIFSVIEEKLQLEASDFLHVGDSFDADYFQPCICGWRGFHLPIPAAIVKQRQLSHDGILKSMFNGDGAHLPIARPG